MIRNDIVLEDTTLRDGEQSPGVAFNAPTKLAILDALLKIGVKSVEIGIPAMGGEELDAMRSMLERKREATLMAWNRGVKEDVKQSLDLGFEAVHISFPTSTLHLEDTMGKDRSWLFKNAADLIKYAKDRGAHVSVSANDVARTEVELLREYACAVADAGADRLRLADTIGLLTPEAYGSRVAAVREVCSVDLHTHCHNDYGFGVANTIAGLTAGARYFHVCVNGMGERAGMPDLATTCMALKHLYGRDLGIRTEGLTALSALVCQASKQPVPPWQPVVGANVFSHESGIHIRGILKNSATFEPYRPEEVGNHRRLVIGKHSGRALLKHILQDNGVEPEEAALARCLELVRSASIRAGGALSVPALQRLYETAASESSTMPG
jgi:homocitrate synthase NifV